MTPRPAGRVTPCTPADARARLRKAQSFTSGAELVLELGEETGLDLPAVAAALSVLAGIAAADAACCRALGERSRGQDHRQAEQLVATVLPHGPQMAKDLKAVAGAQGQRALRRDQHHRQGSARHAGLGEAPSWRRATGPRPLTHTGARLSRRNRRSQILGRLWAVRDRPQGVATGQPRTPAKYV